MERKKECKTCNDGYFINENFTSFICSKCSIENCKKYSIISNQGICEECETDYVKITKNMSDICICNPFYYQTIDGLCLEYGNWIEIEYNIKENSEKYQIMNSIYNEIELKN